MKLRRTRLYVPGNNPHLVENVGLYGADCLILDMEDSVPLSQKFDARILVKYALQNVDFGRSEKWVRINSLDTPFWEKDVEEVVPYVDVLNVPKIGSVEDVEKISGKIKEIEKEKGLKERKIVPIIETLHGLVNAREIAKHERVVAMAWGGEDLTAELGIPKKKALILDHVRAEIVIAAKSQGKMALDTVYSDIRNEEGLFEYARRARYMGFDGVGTLHPNQIEIVHRAFLPDEKEIEEAREIVDAAEKAFKEGRGVITVRGRMVDKPVLERAKKILAYAEVD